MNLKSLEKVLEGVGKLRAASVGAAAASSAALLGLSIPSNVQSAGLVAVAIVIAAVNVIDGYIRGKHVSALPALIAQGAESVAQVQDPRVDAVANDVKAVADRLAALEAKPTEHTPTVAEIIAALTGKSNESEKSDAAPAAATPEPAATPAVTGTPAA